MFKVKLLIVLSLLSSAAIAQDMSFSRHKNCETCSDYILANGRITENTPKDFTNFLLENEGAKTIYFNSIGGSLDGGVKLGEIIRDRRFNTYVGNSYSTYFFNGKKAGGNKVIVPNPICYSACAYAFLGGVRREITPNAQYGMHDFKNTIANNNMFQIRIVENFISNYLKKMDIEPSYLTLATNYRPNEIYILNKDRAVELNVDNTVVEDKPWQLLANNKVLRVLKPTDNGSIDIKIKKEEEKYLIVYTYNIPVSDRVGENLGKAFNSAPLFNMFINNINYTLVPKDKWAQTAKNQYQIVFPTTENTLRAMSSANSLKFDANWENNKNIDPSVEVSTQGIENITKLL